MGSSTHLAVGGTDHFLPRLIAAINQAAEIEMAVAFIRQTGLALLFDALADALQRNVPVRILTGDYLFLTDPQALRTLMLLKEAGANVRVYCTQQATSFHMKAYIFVRQEGQGRAFIGSSNISRSALKEGLEWNLRVDANENPERFAEIRRHFAETFVDVKTVTLTHSFIDRYQASLPTGTSPMEAGCTEVESLPIPNTIQLEALTALNLTRDARYVRGLVVMATGLGKTWLAAFDSRSMNARRVLFVAHREEILAQAEKTFVRICPGAKVGRYTGKAQDSNVDMLFASVQTIGRQYHLDTFPHDYFDYIVVDEFHHASASTYRRLLGHFRPRFLLGLTATPDRTDQVDILSLCDGNEVYRKDLFDGIQSGILCPFQYMGIADYHTDYQAIPWRSGKFNPEKLLSQLATHARAMHALEVWQKHKQTRTLAFCVAKRHAEFMADFFQRRGHRAAAVHSDSELRRNEALARLESGELEIVFSVDLFNEGVDLPSIDTVLMLRPTESKILFLQQLGRGLRQCQETKKQRLVAIDFIGNHISFFRKPEALLNIGLTGKERRAFLESAEQNRLSLPPGCTVNYEPKAIDFMKAMMATRIESQLELYRGMRDSKGRRPTLAEFWRGGGSTQTVQGEYGQWLELPKADGDLTPKELSAFDTHAAFFRELETTKMMKSFKAILLKALVELDAFKNGIETTALAKRSLEILRRHPLLCGDLPAKWRGISGDVDIRQWHAYWKHNAINAFVEGNHRHGSPHFRVENERVMFTSVIAEHTRNAFNDLVDEIADYRLRQYEHRLTDRHEVESPPVSDVLVMQPTIDLQFYRDLRIACGHFGSSTHGDVDWVSVPDSSRRFDPSRHFVARAHGNSMDGGHKPIRHGDHILLEAITPTTAGSISNQILAIEREDVTGDDQYLLRRVTKLGPRHYNLTANNPEYDDIEVKEDTELRTFARFLGTMPAVDLFRYKLFMREDIPAVFGLDYTPGNWQQGHVCPKGSHHHFLLVTLNKQGLQDQHRYHDYFLAPNKFHWQSQNQTTPTGKRGLQIAEHAQRNLTIHLFLRANKLASGKAAPFQYMGEVNYESHTGSKPMSVVWRLDKPLPDQLYRQLSR